MGEGGDESRQCRDYLSGEKRKGAEAPGKPPIAEAMIGVIPLVDISVSAGLQSEAREMIAESNGDEQPEWFCELVFGVRFIKRFVACHFTSN